jgi:serine protease Do
MGAAAVTLRGMRARPFPDRTVNAAFAAAERAAPDPVGRCAGSIGHARQAVVLVFAAALAACAAAPRGQASRGQAPRAQGTAAGAPAAATRPSPAPVTPLSPADIAARGLPTVVTIRTDSSLGTGFVIRPDGWIATNLHVIIGGGHVKVTLRDLRGDRDLEVVDVIAASPEHDLAIVRVEAHGLPAVALGNSDAMRPGDTVVAIGNPFGLEDTVSNGLVSARRKVDDDTEVLQISAPIAPGSSGGPIFNEHGEVIGVATAVLEQGQNLNFGMPARYLVPMMKDPDPVPYPAFAKLVAQVRANSAPKPRQRMHASYALSTLDGCTMDAQKLIVHMVSDAVDAGAPLFNAGNATACYHVYDGAASDLARKLPAACHGPTRALAEAQRHAAGLGDPSAQAWAIRDAFDGLIEVVLKKQPK